MDEPRKISIEKEDPEAFCTDNYMVKYVDGQEEPLFYGDVFECGIFVKGYYWQYNHQK